MKYWLSEVFSQSSHNQSVGIWVEWGEKKKSWVEIGDGKLICDMIWYLSLLRHVFSTSTAQLDRKRKLDQQLRFTFTWSSQVALFFIKLGWNRRTTALTAAFEICAWITITLPFHQSSSAFNFSVSQRNNVVHEYPKAFYLHTTSKTHVCIVDDSTGSFFKLPTWQDKTRNNWKQSNLTFNHFSVTGSSSSHR